MRAKASTSVIAFTVRVDDGRFEPDLGSRAQVRSSSPQKSLSLSKLRLKNPLLPPSVVTLSRRPRMMKSISSTGSPSRTMINDKFSSSKNPRRWRNITSSELQSHRARRATMVQPNPTNKATKLPTA
ncbi:hypothetical protein RJ641_025449 [Dillenia turbinata]|uniref:Uncharacterized protein n=1 Tax=Dillenia turbinata TaxID=194707 RepID=A0AAN8W9T8_9MAGN